MAKDHSADLESLKQTEHENARGLTALETWLGRVSAAKCACRTPADDNGCQRANVTFEETKADQPTAVVAILRRYKSFGKIPVLLVHGATAWRGTFMEPNGGIIGYLSKHFDVWTLDWRGSKLITDPWKSMVDGERVPCALRNGTLDDVIAGELPAAIRIVARETKTAPRLIGHCIGAAVIAAAIARGKLGADNAGEDHAQIAPHVVLSTIGLFYRGGVDTWLRAQERLDSDTFKIWRLSFEEPTGWPDEYERVFKLWESTPYPHCKIPFCRRISTLFGAPYRPNDIGDIHSPNGMLEKQFGVIPLSMLNHIARNVRRGWSGKFDATDRDQDDLAQPQHFGGLKITMIGGRENQLWHRDSVDRMHEWLRRTKAEQVQLKVFSNYGHQDLWWSHRSSAPEGVYSYVKAALSR